MRNWMRMIALFCALSAAAVADLNFSPDSTTPGKWYYDGVDTFSFTQVIEIDSVMDGQADALNQQMVYLPSMTLLSYSSGTYGPGTGTGVLSGGGVVEIKTGSGDTLVRGNLTGGSIFAMFAASSLYPEITSDILITYVDNSIGSTYLAGLSSGMYFDLTLTLQSGTYLDTMITNHLAGSNGFSGTLTAIIPEPATMLLLGLGALLVRKR